MQRFSYLNPIIVITQPGSSPPLGPPHNSPQPLKPPVGRMVARAPNHDGKGRVRDAHYALRATRPPPQTHPLPKPTLATSAPNHAKKPPDLTARGLALLVR